MGHFAARSILVASFRMEDFKQVISDLRQSGFEFESDWFATHFEFRFPRIGDLVRDELQMELRTAIEPWYVLGEEPAGGGTVRFVDSSVERLQVKLTGITSGRYIVTCNQRKIPLVPQVFQASWWPQFVTALGNLQAVFIRRYQSTVH